MGNDKKSAVVRSWLYVGKTISEFKNVYAILEPFPDFEEKTLLVEKSAYDRLTAELAIAQGIETTRISDVDRENIKLRAENAEIAQINATNEQWAYLAEKECDTLRAEVERLRAALTEIGKRALGDVNFSEAQAYGIARAALENK